jgi:succinate-semialdehyde dehydrogenase/glutarate-semialdehyde dehydrogenase
VRENGSPLAEAHGEVTYAAEFFRLVREEAVRNTGTLATAPSGSNGSGPAPADRVALLITPWNFRRRWRRARSRRRSRGLRRGPQAGRPDATDGAHAAPAEQAGVPPGVVNVVPTTRAAALSNAILADARVRKLSFTGSTEVGRNLLAEAAKRVVKCSMELGATHRSSSRRRRSGRGRRGRDGRQDAPWRDLHRGQPLLRRGSGRRGVRVAGWRGRWRRSRVGNGMTPGAAGPLIDGKTRDKVARLVTAATAAGARVRTGGVVPDGEGFFYPPTVLDRVAPDSPILAEEIFGPVAPIVSFRDDAEVIRLANATEHGLMAYVFTRDLARGLRVAEAIEAGMVGLNRGLVSDPAAPFGGVKESGFGREAEVRCSSS